MKLHENNELFKDAVTASSQMYGIPEIFIEKDYWVTYSLYQIFNNEIGKETLFKGGTSLSKCFNLIHRFSEDIDLVVIRKEHETNNQLKNKIKKISKCVSNKLPEIEIDGITNKVGMIRKTVHQYQRFFSGHFDQVNDNLIVESTWLGHFEPYTKEKVNTLIYEMMLKNKLHQLINEYIMNPFDVFVLTPSRTFCEKIMSLVRFSYTSDTINDLRNKIRHIYDIHLMLKNQTLHTFFNSNEFDNMLLTVANDDIISFKNNNGWIKHHPSKAIIFSKTIEIWGKISSSYKGTFKELVFGELPNENEILKTLQLIEIRLKQINWNTSLN